MKRHRTITPVARAIIVMVSVGIIASGVTFAALQSQSAVLQGSKISSATANLLIGNNTDPSSFAAAQQGYTFANIQPGTGYSSIYDHDLYLENAGSIDLALKLDINYGQFFSSGLDLSKTYIILTAPDATMQKISLQTLVNAHLSGGTALNWKIKAGQIADYKIQATIDADGVSSQTTQGTISNLDLVFSGAAVDG